MRFRITIRGEGVELRGYMDVHRDSPVGPGELADAMTPFGLVMASPADDDYNPFKKSPWGPEDEDWS